MLPMCVKNHVIDKWHLIASTPKWKTPYQISSMIYCIAYISWSGVVEKVKEIKQIKYLFRAQNTLSWVSGLKNMFTSENSVSVA